MTKYYQLLIILFCVASISVEADSHFTKDIKPFLSQHCYSCHGPEKQKANIRYDKINSFADGDHHLWTLIYEQITDGEMPPKKKPQPSDADKKKILNWIKAKSIEAVASDETRYVRRLNKREL